VSSRAYLDHPGELHWFTGHGPATVVGPCPHSCVHNATSVVAHGPDFEHYELVDCDVRDGCAGRCRGWVAQTEGSNGRGRLHHVVEFDVESEQRIERDDPARRLRVSE
jgi:hypothetical protein